jgi:hypothetical protein
VASSPQRKSPKADSKVETMEFNNIATIIDSTPEKPLAEANPKQRLNTKPLSPLLKMKRSEDQSVSETKLEKFLFYL